MTLAPRPSPSGCFCILQAIKNWRQEWPGNEAIELVHTLLQKAGQSDSQPQSVDHQRLLQLCVKRRGRRIRGERRGKREGGRRERRVGKEGRKERGKEEKGSGVAIHT